MEQINAFILGILTALVLCKTSHAEWNSTETPANVSVSCNHHDNGSNCTDSTDGRRWSGHFSECPEEFRHYCIHGDCRFVKEHNTASCRCENGYFGTRCEYFDFVGDEKTKIFRAFLVAGLAFLILLIVFICICVHKRYNPRRKKRRKNKTTDEVEKLSSLNCTEVLSLPVNTSDTDAV